MPVRLADAAVASLLQPGDHVDVFAADGRWGAKIVASGVTVTATPSTDEGPWTDGEGLVVVLAMPEQAAALARCLGRKPARRSPSIPAEPCASVRAGEGIESGGFMKGFKDFLMRGNVVDLAVAFVIGLAVVALIGSIVAGIINPLIAAVFGQTDLTSVGTFTINNADFSLGLVLDALVNFLAVAAVVYFLIVLPMNKIKERMAKPDEAAAPTEVELLTEIRDALAAGAAPRATTHGPRASSSAPHVDVSRRGAAGRPAVAGRRCRSAPDRRRPRSAPAAAARHASRRCS